MTIRNYSLTTQEELDVLDFDPWGDRDATYHVLREGFCNVRRPHKCAICFAPIVPGQRVWYRAEVDDGKVMTFRFCPECCWCVARRYDDDDVSWDRLWKRWDIGRARAEEERK